MCALDSWRFSCLYSTILGDNEPVPLQPNLENSGGGNSDIGKFLVWPSSTDRPYMTFEFGSAQSVTAINIEFLNYPTQGFSLPNLELYSVIGPAVVVPNNLNSQRIEFELRNNNVLSQDDYQVTNINLIFSSTSHFFLLRWNYTGVYNIDFFMVSEVDFCSDTQQPGETQITFQDPQSNSVIISTVEQLIVTRNITLSCTVSSSGLFEWRWRKNGSLMSSNGKYMFFTADGTRTSILQLTGLSVSDAAEYTCEVRRKSRGGEYMSRIQTLSFPGNTFSTLLLAETLVSNIFREITSPQVILKLDNLILYNIYHINYVHVVITVYRHVLIYKNPHQSYRQCGIILFHVYVPVSV